LLRLSAGLIDLNEPCGVAGRVLRWSLAYPLDESFERGEFFAQGLAALAGEREPGTRPPALVSLADFNQAGLLQHPQVAAGVKIVDGCCPEGWLRGHIWFPERDALRARRVIYVDQ